MTVAFTDPTVHPASAPFYRMFPWEPIAPLREIKVDSVVQINNMRMEQLLDRIPAAVGQGGNLFIIFHGTEAGLSMRLANDVPAGLHANAQIMEILDSNRTDIEAAQLCMFPNPNTSGAQRIRTIRDKMQRVKDLRMNSVELRACNTGQNNQNMQTIKRFFNCQSLGAPDLRDSYFGLRPNTAATSQAEQNWRNSHSTHRMFDVPAGGRVGISVQMTGHATFNTSMIVNKNLAPSFWADVYLSRLHPHSVGMGLFHGHALFETSASFPLIFPGDDTYTQHLVHV